MNELNALRALRAEVPEPAPADTMAAQARLQAAIQGDPVRRARLPISRPRLIALLTAGTGLAVAGVVTASTLIAAAESGPAGPGRPPATGSPTGGADAGPRFAAAPVTAGELLERAVTAAKEDGELDPRPDQFLAYESITMYTAEIGGSDGTVGSRYLYRTKRKIWLSVDGTHPGALTIEYLEPKAYPGFPIPDSARRQTGTIERMALCGYATSRSYLTLSKLPADADGMLRHLRSGAESASPSARDTAAWTAVGDLLRESYLPRAQRIALYQAAARISGVELVGDAEDAAGRKGIAVARVDRQTGVRDGIIFDPVSYRYLGERGVVVDQAVAKAPRGTLVAATAELSVTVADAAPAVPTKPGPKGDSCAQTSR